MSDGFDDELDPSFLFQPGGVCGGYSLGKVLGIGSSSVVFATTAPEGDPRAIKIQLVTEQEDPKQTARSAQEGSILATLEDEHVVRFYDAGRDRGYYWMLLERIVGQSLRKRMTDATGVLPRGEVLRWLYRAAQGVAAAHANDVVHRDLKPSNILLPDGGGVKVIDFGRARHNVAWGVKTTHDDPRGAAMYRAPEQALWHVTDKPLDVFSMGVILYETITGVHPMGRGALNAMQVALWHMKGNLIPPRQYDQHIPWELEKIILHAMAKNPADRPTMSEFAAKLKALVGPELVSVRRAADNARDSEDPGLARTAKVPKPHADPTEPVSGPPTDPPTHPPTEPPTDPTRARSVTVKGTHVMPASPASDPGSGGTAARRTDASSTGSVTARGTHVMPATAPTSPPAPPAPQDAAVGPWRAPLTPAGDRSAVLPAASAPPHAAPPAHVARPAPPASNAAPPLAATVLDRTLASPGERRSSAPYQTTLAPPRSGRRTSVLAVVSVAFLVLGAVVVLLWSRVLGPAVRSPAPSPASSPAGAPAPSAPMTPPSASVAKPMPCATASTPTPKVPTPPTPARSTAKPEPSVHRLLPRAPGGARQGRPVPPQ